MRPSPRARLARAAALPLLVLTLLLGGVVPAQADETAPADETAQADELAADHLVLATEGHGEAPGLDPRPADDPENEFAPDDYEPNFLWGAAVGLGVLVLGGAGLMALMYKVMVRRSEDAGQKKG